MLKKFKHEEQIYGDKPQLKKHLEFLFDFDDDCDIEIGCWADNCLERGMTMWITLDEAIVLRNFLDECIKDQSEKT